MQSDANSSMTRKDDRKIAGRRIAVAASFLYAGMLLLLVIAARFWGERCAPLSICLYLPAQIWLLPLGVLIPAAVIFDRRLLALCAGCLLLIVFGFAGFRFGWSGRTPKAGVPTLTVLTNNIAQSGHQSMAAFVEREKPDLIVLEDAAGRAPYYRRAYPGWSVAFAGQFVLVSKYPILSATPVADPAWRGIVAASFRVDWPPQPFTLFAVHMPTPRPDFLRLRAHGFLVEAIRRRTTLWQRFAAYNESMQTRVTVARSLAGRMAAEPGPVLAVGDFNMPNWGFVHSLFASRMTDAFEAAGSGFGFTFPGATRNPLTLFGPWLRLDCIFSSNAWTPLSCNVEPRRPSKHRAVAATFELGKSN